MIERVWKYALNELLKDFSGGWLRPNVFNTIINQVNREVFDEAVKAYEANRFVTDISRPFVITVGDGDLPPLAVQNGYIDLPVGYEYLSSIRLIEYFDPNKPCEEQFNSRGRVPKELTDEQFNRVRDSILHKPTIKRPAITIQNNKIRVLPDGFERAQLTYFRKPAQPFFDWILLPGGEPYIQYLPPGGVHDGTVLPPGTPSRSVDLEWPDMAETMISEKVVFHASRRLNDPKSQMTKSQ